MLIATQDNPYEGWTSLDEFLEEEGTREEITARATERVTALQLQRPGAERNSTPIG